LTATASWTAMPGEVPSLINHSNATPTRPSQQLTSKTATMTPAIIMRTRAGQLHLQRRERKLIMSKPMQLAPQRPDFVQQSGIVRRRAAERSRIGFHTRNVACFHLPGPYRELNKRLSR
jgi:hypothetical protein